MVGEKIAKLENFKVHDKVEVCFNLRGRLYQKDGKENCFTSLLCWKIAMAQEAKDVIQNMANNDGGGNDDLPF